MQRREFRSILYLYVFGICNSNDDETEVLLSSSSTRVCFSLRAGHCRRVVLLCKVGDVVP